MTRPDMSVADQAAKAALIRRISSLEELDGYEAQSLKDRRFVGETALLMARRGELLRGRG